MIIKVLARLKNSGWRYWWLVVIIFLCDLSTKWCAEYCLSVGQSLHLLWCFNLTLVYNTGAAFSLLNNGLAWSNLLLSIVATIIVIIIMWRLYYNSNSSSENFALAMIVGGALGNLVGRLYSHHVVDFLDVAVANWHWPIFNFADMMICCGAGLLCKNISTGE